MKKLALPFLFLLSICAVTSCGFLGSGMSPDNNESSYTAKTHAPLQMDFYLRCPYDSGCDASVDFGLIRQTIQKGSYTYEATNYKYTFVSDSVRQTVSMNSIVPLSIHDDGHVYFSLFDETGAEKGYDVDLSGTIHSWTRRGDSVDIVLPAYIDTMGIIETKENNIDFIRWYLGDSLPNRTKTISYEHKWAYVYGFFGWLNNQSSYGTDRIYISASIGWRPYNL